MTTKTGPISLADSSLGEIRHVCAFFNSDEEEYRVLLPFIREGFSCGHRAIHVLDPNRRCAHLERLGEAGVNTAAAEASGQLEVHSNSETYLRDGQFDQDRMLAVFEEFAGRGGSMGFPLSRIVCQMDWAAGRHEFVDQVIEFEARVNDVWRRHDDAVVCTYRLGQFGGDAVIDIIRTHPMVIVGGILQRNPFFVPAEQFLPEFRQRRKAASAAPSTR